jgi:cytochrome b6-f complex iron-sulfur subunit
MERRQFLQRGIYASFVLAAAPTLFHSCKKYDEDEPDVASIQIDLNAANYTGLKTSGGFAYYENIIIANTGSGFIAMSKLCTHEGCTISYDHIASNLPCPCHGTVYSKSGEVLNGPAMIDLKIYAVSREEDILTIK